MVQAKTIVASRFRSKLWREQRVCVNGGDVAHTPIVKIVKLACDSINTRRKKVTLLQHNTNKLGKFEEACAASRTLRGKLEVGEGQVTALKRS